MLLARIKALLRRFRHEPSAARSSSTLTVGDLHIDPRAHTVTVAGQPVELSPREFDLLCVLASEAGRVLSVDDLVKRVWGAEFDGEPQVVYVHIRRLREKLEKDPRHPTRIVSVRGVGYKLEREGA